MKKVTAAKPAMDSEYYKLEQLFMNHIDISNRRIYLAQDIEPETIDTTVKALHYLEKKSKLPIEIYISSEGGDLYQMFYLYDMIRNCKNEIRTIGSGVICSAAVLLLASGDHRACTSNAWLMAHQSQAIMSGKHDEIQSQALAYREQEKRMWSLVGSHSRKSATEWQNLARAKGEIWLDAEKMLEWGVVDEIIQSHRAVKPKEIKTRGK